MESKKPIPAPVKSLSNIIQKGVAGIQAELIGAAPIHKQFLASASMHEADLIQNSERLEQRVTGNAPVGIVSLERGDDVIDLERKRKGTIIRELKASAEDGQKRFEIVDSKGNSWKQKENKLRRR